MGFESNALAKEKRHRQYVGNLARVPAPACVHTTYRHTAISEKQHCRNKLLRSEIHATVFHISDVASTDQPHKLRHRNQSLY